MSDDYGRRRGDWGRGKLGEPRDWLLTAAIAISGFFLHRQIDKVDTNTSATQQSAMQTNDRLARIETEVRDISTQQTRTAAIDDRQQQEIDRHARELSRLEALNGGN